MKFIKTISAALLLSFALCGCANAPGVIRAEGLISPEAFGNSPNPVYESEGNDPSPSQSGAPQEAASVQPSAPEPPARMKGGGSFKTEIIDFSKNRINNIKLVLKKLDGIVIKNGEEFSFNETVGPRTMKKGYKDAIIFIDGEKVKETGGGICQVSSTIYQAALASGFEVTERHQHQREVYYLELGDDATVYYGELDLKFINNSGADMSLKCWMDDKNVWVSFEPAV